MGKTLKIGFAMGGGTSCGTFSGSALTEAIKQAIVYAQPRNEAGELTGERYDKIVVDVFSGASAGTMSLALMLRGLVGPVSPKHPINKEVKLRLQDQFGEDYNRLSTEAKNDLIRAQQLQDLQYSTWVKEINLETLVPKQDDKLLNNTSILNSQAVYDIAKRYFATVPDPGDKRILADRVLFGASIANLTGINYDARTTIRMRKTPGEFDELMMESLNAGLVSKSHRELRVFDFNLAGEFENLAKDEPRTWCRFDTRNNPRSDDNTDGYQIGSLKDAATWAQVVCTAAASGAFPFAFSPVPLRRRKHEFGVHWPQEIDHKTSHIFSYVDGGTFLNEPIRDAFRMAAYLDSLEENPDSFDRRILFVDPIVDKIKTDLRVPLWNSFDENGDLADFLNIPRNFLGRYRNFQVSTRSVISKIAANIAGAFFSEAQVKPEDKIFDTREAFYLRKFVTTALAKLNDEEISPQEVREAYKACEEHTSKLWQHTYLPNTPKFELLLSLWIKQKKYGTRIDINTLEGFKAWATENNDEPFDGDQTGYYRLLVNILAELNMKILGKDDQAYLLPIAPLKKTNNQEKYVLEELPGAPIQGFTGFGNEAAGVFEFEFGKDAAIEMMKEFRLIPSETANWDYWAAFKNTSEECENLAGKVEARGDRETPFLKFKDYAYENEYLQKLDGVLDRIRNILVNKKGGFLNTLGDWFITEKRIAEFLNRSEQKTGFEFRVEVPKDGRFELDGKGRGNDSRGHVIDGKQYLVALVDGIENESGEFHWEGYHVRGEYLPIYHDRRIIWDKLVTKINLPGKELYKKALTMAYPVFSYKLNNNVPEESSASGWQVEDLLKPLEESIFDD